jgi:hypothetical protein
MEQYWQWVKKYGLVLVWLLSVVLMYHSYLSDPPVTTSDAAYRYGRNLEGELQRNLLLSSIEIGLLYTTLWPFERSIPRVLFACVLFLPWTFIWTVLAMHAGGITLFHVLWLWLVCAGLMIALLYCLVRYE